MIGASAGVGGINFVVWSRFGLVVVESCLAPAVLEVGVTAAAGTRVLSGSKAVRNTTSQ